MYGEIPKDQQPINETLYLLENLINVNGHNYSVVLGLDILENCASYDQCLERISRQYENLQRDVFVPTPTDRLSLSKALNHGFSYRGDEGAGLTLTPEQEEELLTGQKILQKFLELHISDQTHIYTYPKESGLPGYPVWWTYTFLLLNVDRPSILFYGSASD